MEMEDQGTKEFDPENTYKFNSNSNDDAPEIDISNISWEKKFDNNEAISMHWEDKVKEAAGEFGNEQSLLQESSNSEELSKLVKDEEHTSNLSHTKQEQDKALTEHSTSPKELITGGSPADGTKSESDISEDEQNITCIMKHFENNELLSPYVNKLSIIKAVAEYISLDEPEGNPNAVRFSAFSFAKAYTLQQFYLIIPRYFTYIQKLTKLRKQLYCL
jgi:hypothetical protein